MGKRGRGDSRASSQPPHPASGHSLPEGRGKEAGAGRPSRPSAPPRTVADALADLIPTGLGDRAGPAPTAAVPIFRDDAQVAGLHSVYDYDPTPLWRMPEMMGGGVGLLDYDGDGWLDVYAVQGGTLPNEPSPPRAPQGDRLFRNRGDGTFEDVTAAAGLMAFPGGYG